MRVFTDASSRGDKSGIAYILTNNKDEVIKRGAAIAETGDNNTGELMAVLYALREINNRFKHLTILSDSCYVVNGLRNNRFRASDQPIADEIYKLMKKRKVALFWIKGHCQDGTVLSFYNKKVDKLAKMVRIEWERQQQEKKRKKLKNAIKKGKDHER